MEKQFGIKEEYEAKRKELLRKCDERISKNKKYHEEVTEKI